ncbi:MAG: hypothetical protein ACREA0_30615 [bacterium]
MIIATGIVRDGSVAFEKGVLPEGARVTVLAPEGDETFEVSAEEKVLLLEAIAECERGETVPAEEVLAELRRR